MFTVVAATVFFAAFLLALATIIAMFALYRDKMTAALLFEPMPQQPRVYRLQVTRRRAAGAREIRPAIVQKTAFATA